MTKWTFGGPKGVTTTVDAPTEEEARHLAMVSRWGPPHDAKLGVSGRYKGLGLWLVLT